MEEGGFVIKLSKLSSAVHATLLFLLAHYSYDSSQLLFHNRETNLPPSQVLQLYCSGKEAAKLPKGQTISRRPNLENLYYETQNQRIRPNLKGNVMIREIQSNCFQAFHQTRSWKRT